MKAKAICDGRGNAGTGACAVVIELETGEVFEYAKKLDPCTNIVAEHMAIQFSVQKALQHGVKELLIWNDSQTPVNHVRGTYKCEKSHLKPILETTWKLASCLDSVSIEWVPREHTKRPDALCREIDRPLARRERPGGPLVRQERKNPFASS